MTRAAALFCSILITLASCPASAAKKPDAKITQKAQVCIQVDPLFQRLRASGIEFEDVHEPAAVKRIAEALRSNGGEFPEPTRIIVVFLGENAKIGIVVGDCLRAIASAPSAPVRLLVHAVHGQTIRWQV